ncbi:DUF1838 family protein [Eilatimonas milleporae]|uniref:Uncharacterized protein DUF1838 n=1 Tax=Eilatimonas milleporae TaxID=911205 RepID=A0A3M0CFN7_9PROT|nr:DUF1838 family protein [Eilatimonas milleporae]RMB07627.1 uncharacterized protein DUF1838 [Eilatimonas milleporae]
MKIWKLKLVCLACMLVSAGAQGFDPDNPRDNIEAWVKLRGDASGKPTYRVSYMSAFGVPRGDFSVEMFTLASVTKQVIRKMPNGDYEARWRGCGLYTDPRTGEFISSFKNPFTGETIALKPLCSMVTGARYSVKDGMSMLSDFPMESTIFNKPYILNWKIVGDTAFVERVAHTEWEEPGSGRLKHEMTIDSYVAPLSEIMDPNVTSINVPYSYTLVTEWMTMLNMQDRAGGMLWKSIGTKHHDVNEVPAELLEEIDRIKPGEFDKPITFD